LAQRELRWWANVQVQDEGKTKHYDLSYKYNPKIQNVKFEKNYHINGSQYWKGERYAACARIAFAADMTASVPRWKRQLHN